MVLLEQGDLYAGSGHYWNREICMLGQGIIGTERSVCWVGVLLEQGDLCAGFVYYWNSMRREARENKGLWDRLSDKSQSVFTVGAGRMCQPGLLYFTILPHEFES